MSEELGVLERLGHLEQQLSLIDKKVSLILEKLDTPFSATTGHDSQAHNAGGRSLAQGATLSADDQVVTNLVPTSNESSTKSVPPTALQVSRHLQISQEPYVYRALDSTKSEIRVLALMLDDQRSATLSGRLMPHSLEGGRKFARFYTALSYVWGEPKLESCIWIDGHPLLITKSLESALQHICEVAKRGEVSIAYDADARCRICPLWVDQVCINQCDLEERNGQVGLMRSIYKSAFQTVIWLGEAVTGSDKALELVDKIGNSRRPGPFNKEVCYQTFSHDEVVKHWRALRVLFDLPWWERAWVRQEACVSKSLVVLWGETLGQLDNILEIVEALKYAEHLGWRMSDALLPSNRTNLTFYHHAETINKLRSISGRGNRFVVLQELLTASIKCKASDPRDKVFSVLGLADPQLYSLRPNYELSVTEVLKITARDILTKRSGLELLGVAPNLHQRYGLPSWVPNLLEESEYEPFEGHGGHFVEQDPVVSFDHDVLLVDGFFLGPITEFCDLEVPKAAAVEELDEVYECWRKFATAKTQLEDFGFKSEQHLQFICSLLEIEVKTDRRGDLLPGLEGYRGIDLNVLDPKAVHSYLLWDGFHGNMHPLQPIRAALKKYGAGRRLGAFYWKHQIPVLLPAAAQIDDLIVIFQGADMPYLLRKHGQDEYKLVGQARVPIVVFSEAVNMGSRSEMNTIRII